MLKRYDIVIGLPTYERFDMLINVLRSITKYPGNFKTKIIINDDCSTDPRYQRYFGHKMYEGFADIDFIRSTENLGRKGYWKTVTNILQQAREYEFKYLIWLADDLELCKDFLTQVVWEHERVLEEKPYDNIIGTSYGHTEDKIQWGVKDWVDGLMLLERDFCEFINYKIRYPGKIKPGRGSRVWQQVSNIIHHCGFKIHRPSQTYISHLGHTESKMHPGLRAQMPYIITKTVE